ncbi:MAG: YraN family protein [Bacteroidales bacterium]|jgi:putative endonuclease|nr:YraN family protein [Bacteroidales bacterium]
MITEKKQFGNRGEELARNYLIEHQYKILASKWQASHLEVDIIAETETYIIFCEVKTRSTNAFMSPQEAVTTQKQKNIIRAANLYILQYKIKKEVRFDIISILLNSNNCTIEHIPDAFSPRW